MYLKGNKADACKKLSKYLRDQKVSPRGVFRTWQGIRQRLSGLFKKYYEAKRKKSSTGWGAGKDEETIKGIFFSFSFFFFLMD
jgi:hypothetical protein